jgi:predicted transcriptional regulator
MAQRKPEEQTTFDQVLKLVHQLTAKEQQQLLEQLKLEDLRREIRKGIEASERGEVVSHEELNQRLDAKHAEILERQKK